jgi:hypothetical protein
MVLARIFGRKKNRPEQKLEYVKLSDEEVLVIAHIAGQEPVKTVVDILPSDAVIEEQECESASH